MNNFSRKVPPTFRHVIETNLLENFKKYESELNFTVEEYHERLEYFSKLVRFQAAPDMILSYCNMLFGIDLKSGGQVGIGRSKIVVCSDKKYSAMLLSFLIEFERSNPGLPEARLLEIKSLVASLNYLYNKNYSEYMDLWLKCLSVLETKEYWVPPLRIDSYFCTSTLTDIARQRFMDNAAHMLVLDAYLKSKSYAPVPFRKELLLHAQKKFDSPQVQEDFFKYKKKLIENPPQDFEFLSELKLLTNT